MERRSLLVAVAVAAIAAAVVGAALLAFAGSSGSKHGAAPAQGVKQGSSPAPGVYTFAQAVKAGVVPSLKEQEQESGLPLCGTKGPTGSKARAALKKVIARNDGDTCMADPRQTTISVCCAPRPHLCTNSVPSANNGSSNGQAGGLYRALSGLVVSSPEAQAGISVPSGFRFPDSRAFWVALGRTDPKLLAEKFLARLAYGTPVRTAALTAGALQGAYLVAPPYYDQPRQDAADPWGGAAVRIIGYAHTPTSAVLIANRVTTALCKYIVSHTPPTLTGEQRFQPEPLPPLSATPVSKLPAGARHL